MRKLTKRFRVISRNALKAKKFDPSRRSAMGVGAVGLTYGLAGRGLDHGSILKNVRIRDNTGVHVYESAEQPVQEKDWIRRSIKQNKADLEFFLKDKEAARKKLLEGVQIQSIDPDIIAMESLSPGAKIRMQKNRLVERAMENFEKDKRKVIEDYIAQLEDKFNPGRYIESYLS